MKASVNEIRSIPPFIIFSASATSKLNLGWSGRIYQDWDNSMNTAVELLNSLCRLRVTVIGEYTVIFLKLELSLFNHDYGLNSAETNEITLK